MAYAAYHGFEGQKKAKADKPCDCASCQTGLGAAPRAPVIVPFNPSRDINEALPPSALTPGGGRFPTLEKVIIAYIRDKLDKGERFYISPELNSDALEPAYTMGFWQAILAAVTTAASTAGSAIVAAAPQIAQIAGSVAQMRAGGAANGRLAATGSPVTIPQQLQPAAVAAVQQDLFGISPTMLALIAAGVAVIALVKK